MAVFNIKLGAYADESQIGQSIKNTLKRLEHTDSTKFKVTIDGKDYIRQIDTFTRKNGELIKIQRDLTEVTTQYGKVLQNASKMFGKDAFNVTEVKQAYDHMRTLTTETEKYISQEGKRITKITESDDRGRKFIKTIEQTTDSFGNLITRIRTTDENLNPLGQDITKIDRQVQTATKDFHKFRDELGNTVTEITEVDNKGIKTIHRTIEGTNELGVSFRKTETEIRNANGEVVSFNHGLEETIRDETKLEQKSKTATTQIKNQTNATNAHNNSLKNNNIAVNDFIATMGKVIKFQVITKIITGFTTACKNAVEVVKEFDTQLTEFKKVSDLSGDALDNYTKKLGDLGTAVARTRSQMVESATQFKKAGYNEETSAQLAQIASLFQNIADSELSAGDSATFVISQMKAFRKELELLGDEGTQATYVIDSINEVSNNMAVSSTDISTALSKTASAMSALGNNYNETIALVTSG